MSTSATFITCTDLSFRWPDGTTVFTSLSWAVGPGRTGLIGLNGSGKSTLLRLITGTLLPTRGAVTTHGDVGYLPQDLVLGTSSRADQALHIAECRAALHAIEQGDPDPEHFRILGDDWDIEERARAVLTDLGLGDVGLDRTVGELSGGQAVLLGLAGLLIQRPRIMVLDEPTNNLDRDARERLYSAVRTWPGVMVIVSHDRELLQLVDQIAELRDGTITTYGGNLDAYEAAVATEQAAAERAARAADADVRRQRRDLTEAHTKLAQRKKVAAKAFVNKKEPRAVMRAKKRTSQVSAGKHRILHEQRLQDAQERLASAEEAVRDDDPIRIDLPETAVPASRIVLTTYDLALKFGSAPGDVEIRGPERVALTGRNGSGKTTLLRTLAGDLAPSIGAANVRVPLRYLPQRLDVLDDDLSIVANVARLAPSATNNDIRAQLARFLFRGSRADQSVATLSGGERFRATLATLLLAQPAPQLLMLDEPTNNLDLASVGRLTDALTAYRGALIVASHDQPFLARIGITRELCLGGEE